MAKLHKNQLIAVDASTILSAVLQQAWVAPITEISILREQYKAIKQEADNAYTHIKNLADSARAKEEAAKDLRRRIDLALYAQRQMEDAGVEQVMGAHVPDEDQDAYYAVRDTPRFKSAVLESVKEALKGEEKYEKWGKQIIELTGELEKVKGELANRPAYIQQYREFGAKKDAEACELYEKIARMQKDASLA